MVIDAVLSTNPLTISAAIVGIIVALVSFFFFDAHWFIALCLGVGTPVVLLVAFVILAMSAWDGR